MYMCIHIYSLMIFLAIVLFSSVAFEQVVSPSHTPSSPSPPGLYTVHNYETIKPKFTINCPCLIRLVLFYTFIVCSHSLCPQN